MVALLLLVGAAVDILAVDTALCGFCCTDSSDDEACFCCCRHVALTVPLVIPPILPVAPVVTAEIPRFDPLPAAVPHRPPRA